jgi:hypothetical protein
MAQKESPKASLASLLQGGAALKGAESLMPDAGASLSGLAQTEAQNAAWNAGADAAVGTAGQGALGGVGLGGIAAGGYTGKQQLEGAGKILKDEKISMPQAASLFALTGGGSLLANKVLGRGESHLEEKARGKLAEQGVNVPNSGVKEWENNQTFQQSRNEADLVGKDIINSASLYSLPGYSKLDPTKQEAVANEALKQQLVREHNGGIDISPSASLSSLIDSSQGGNSSQPRRNVGEQKKARKKAALVQLLPELQPEFSVAPDYAANPDAFIRNPYL